MNEVLFTLRTLILAGLIVTLMQIRVAGTTVEAKAEQWLETSKVAHYVQSTAAGGVLAAKDLYQSILGSWTGSTKTSQATRASR